MISPLLLVPPFCARFFLLLLLGTALVWLTSCGSLPRTAAGLYPDQPKPGKVSGSWAQEVQTRTYSKKTFDEVFDATYKATLARGFDVEIQDRKLGKISGKGHWPFIGGNGPNQASITFAAYVQEVDRTPTIRLTLLVDRMGFTGAGGVIEQAAAQIITDIQKQLAAD